MVEAMMNVVAEAYFTNSVSELEPIIIAAMETQAMSLRAVIMVCLEWVA